MKYRHSFNSRWPKPVFKEYRKKDSNIWVLRSIDGGDISEIFERIEWIHRGIVENDLGEVAESKELELLRIANMLRTIFQGRKRFPKAELRELQMSIYSFKNTFVKVFPKAKCMQPNFENLDYIVQQIRNLGPLYYVSTQRYEVLHREVKRCLHSANLGNIEKNVLIALNKRHGFRLAGFDLESILENH